MLFVRAMRQAAATVTARTTVLGAAALACCLAPTSFAYAASLKQDVNSPFTESTQFTNPAAPQPIVPPAAAAAARNTGKAKAPPSLPKTTPADTAATVNKLLAPRQSDPNVPLPQENLAEIPSQDEALRGPRLYGHDESGNGVVGAVLGLRIPIPADRGASATPSTSGAKPAP